MVAQWRGGAMAAQRGRSISSDGGATDVPMDKLAARQISGGVSDVHAYKRVHIRVCILSASHTGSRDYRTAELPNVLQKQCQSKKQGGIDRHLYRYRDCTFVEFRPLGD